VAEATDPPNLIRLVPAKEAGPNAHAVVPGRRRRCAQEVFEAMSFTYSDRRATGVGIWRTRDIVVTAVIGVGFGVAFWLFQTIWGALNGLGPAQNVLYGVWLLPAIVAPLIVRKPGAALFAEIVAAGLSALLGSVWSVDVLLSGFLQGGAAELVFAATRYRVWTWPVLVAASLAAMAAAWVHDWIVYYPTASIDFIVAIGVFMAVSAIVLLPIAAVLLVRALRDTGVLEGFPG
jgi:energy-coupling factor transport system permease protein